ncbi:hypothetical protein SAMN05216188_106285 [Lentzea xinjiangensis]|uniref:ABC-2 type transport system permease protein n=2 Tax=Lentzea xinjiangensis TaxID=402600 RepID=A0A1H9K425_9PSEU|nr:hypothetical protein SAMN05216188_106285 [Lentzea xinjiangensis]
MRQLALYARSRGVPAALVVLPVVVFVAWLALHTPWTALSASLTSLAAVLVVTVGLAGQDPELDSSTAVPWPLWRFGHLVAAAVPAAVSVLLVQQLGQEPFDAAFVVRDTAGMIGLAGLAATVAGARFAPAAPVLWWAVAAMVPPGDSLPGRIATWPLGPPDDAVTTWTAGVLFVAGVAAYSARGGRR